MHEQKPISQQEKTARADTHAVDTGHGLHELLDGQPVILFGSRARGDHRADSDIDLLTLEPHQNHFDKRLGHLNALGKRAAIEAYGEGQAPEVQVIPMHPGIYRRLSHSRNFLAAKVAMDGVFICPNPELMEHPGDFDLEPLYARDKAAHAYKASTVCGEWKRHYPQELDDVALEAQRAITAAHQAIASAAGLTIGKHVDPSEIRRMMQSRGHQIPNLGIPMRQYTWYDHHGYDSIPPFVTERNTARRIQTDVDWLLKLFPTLRQEAKTRWERWLTARKSKPTYWGMKGI